MKIEYDAIKNNLRLFAQVVDIFASSLEKPKMCHLNHGFRYESPTVKHFCVLKAVRMVSGLNAAILLAKGGFSQEVWVLMRTIVEASSQINFILAGLENNSLMERQQKVVDDFFKDYQRNSSSGDFSGQLIRQEDVHKEISKVFEDSETVKRRLSNIYRNFSNYIHGHYPEIIDLYGGCPGHFHMEGMAGTPKDQESLAIITEITNSVSLALSQMALKFDMTEAMRANPNLRQWFPE